MARRTKTPERRRPAQGLTAAGRPIDLANPKEIAELGKRPLKWQEDAYSYYAPGSPKAVGEVWFSGRYVSESISRIRLFAGYIVDPKADPVSVDSDEAREAGVTDAEIATCTATLERVTNSRGGQADILRGGALNDFLAGEFYLIGRTVDGQEEWEAHSTASVIPVEGNRAARLKESPDQAAAEAISLEGATLCRIWLPNPRWPQLPDCAMGAAITYCEDLWILTQSVRAAATSRIPAGILGIPDDDTVGPLDLDDEQDGDQPRDDLAEQILKHMSTPISNPGDAAALVPFLLRMAPDLLEKVKPLSLARDIDKLAIELRGEARAALAATIDLPADVLTGKTGLNDWSAFSVDAETWRNHLAPRAERICTGMTAGYYRPNLVGVDEPRRHVIWYDASDVIVEAGRDENTKWAHENLLISDEAARSRIHIAESDAPTPEEYAARAELKRPLNGQMPAGGPENGPPTPQGPNDVQASAVRLSLGYRLATLERNLIARLVTAADAELRRALDKAGNRIVASARKANARNGEAVRSIVASASAMDVASKLGPELVAALGFTTDSLLNGAIDSLEPRWDAWVEQAQRQALRYIEAEGDPFADEGALIQSQDRDRAAGWAVFAGALAATASAALFRPEQPRSLGEHDATSLVPAGAVRGALATAGGGPLPGAPSATAESGEGAGGLLSGQNIRDAFRAAALVEIGWVWVYGDPSSRTTPFPPHEALDGVEFATWEDPVLANPESFPETDFLFPSDHDGCSCSFARNGAASVESGDASTED